MSGIGVNASISRAISGRRRWFTPQRAGRSLVLVKRIVADLVRNHRLAHDLEESIESAQAAGMEALSAAAGEELLRAAKGLRQCLEELEEAGVEMQDLRLGMVDFPAREGRREIRLCWRWGEPAVTHWHEMDESCGQRRVIENL
jgi:hypothetical protein